jgi:murein hydrolase activator
LNRPEKYKLMYPLAMKEKGKYSLLNRYHIKIQLLVILILGISSFSNAQTRQDLEQKRTKTEEEIKLSNQILIETEQSKAAGVNRLLIIKKRISLREQLIIDITNQIALIEQQINEKAELINKLENEIKILKEEYARLIYFAYKNRSNYERIMFILSAQDFNQAYRRVKYIQQYTKYRQKQAEQIEYKQKDLEYEIGQLKDRKNEKVQFLSQKEQEKYLLSAEQQKENQEIINLKKKERELKKKIEDHKKAMNKIEKEIADLIAKELEEQRKAKGLSLSDEAISTGFKNSRGKHVWPIEKGIIIREFGENNHPVLKGIVINNEGIDIQTSKDERVKSIYDGIVKKVFAVPGANMAVIIRHGHYLTLYSNIVNVRVKPGDKVVKGQYLGEVYYTKNDDNSSVLHLRIYEETKVLNPKIWLSKK